MSPFANHDVARLPVLDHLDDDVPFDLEEQLFAVLDVVGLAGVRTADVNHLESASCQILLVPTGASRGGGARRSSASS